MSKNGSIVIVEDDDDQATALRRFVLVIKISVDDPGYFLFRTAANAVNEEVFESFSMFHLAGLKDFSFMKKCQNVGDLRARLLVTGVGAGAGQVWGRIGKI